MSELPTGKIGIMVCRDADQPDKPGYDRGFKCEICGRDVMMSKDAQPRREELYVLCQNCGWLMNDRLASAPGGVRHQVSPGALAQLVEFTKTGKMR